MENYDKELIDMMKGELGMSDEELNDLFKGSVEDSEEKDENKDEYSEEKEKELEKAMNDAKLAFDEYSAKKPEAVEPEIEKSTPTEEGSKDKEVSSEILKSLVNAFASKNKETETKIEDISKSLEVFAGLAEKLDGLAEKVDKLGEARPSAQGTSFDKSVLQKSLEDGIKGEDGATIMSAKVHRDKIAEVLSEISEAKPELRKSIDNEIINFIGGEGNLSSTGKGILQRERNIIVR